MKNKGFGMLQTSGVYTDFGSLYIISNIFRGKLSTNSVTLLTVLSPWNAVKVNPQ
jgi:hypothetical protein